MAKLFKDDAKAPLCYCSSSLSFHTWVSMNLSKSYPSSEVRNNTVKWSEWFDQLSTRCEKHWRRAGIYDAILLSKLSINRDENLLDVAMYFWNSSTNTSDFRVGPMSPTLLDMAQIFKFRSHGRLVDSLGDYHRRNNGERVAQPFDIPNGDINQHCAFSNYLKKFTKEKDKNKRHMLSLLYWLNRFIFPNKCLVVLLEHWHWVHLFWLTFTRIYILPH